MTTIPDDIMETAWAAYLAPCAIGSTDSDFIASIARALLAERMAERERCAAINDEMKYRADAAFDECIRRSRKGERNLDLAAATAAGMSHAARKAAAATRKGGSHE